MSRRAVMPPTSARYLGLADLARSGLDAEDATKLGITFLTPADTEKLLPGHSQPAIRLPYHDLRGKSTGLYRVRFLAPPPAGAFGAQATEVKPKYGQPTGSPVGIYFPPNLGTAWEALAADTTKRVWITEGEKKAAAATKWGFPCIGLGGVWSFGDVKTGRDLLPELEAISWRTREVVVCYDADVMTKREVAKALGRLLEALIRRGAEVYTLILPELGPGKKTGLDDFLVARGPEQLGRLLNEEQELPRGPLARELWRLNERYAVVHHPPSVYDEMAIDGHGRVSPQPLSFSNFCQLEAPRQALKHEGERTLYVEVAREWLAWPGRREYSGLTYRPGEPLVIEATSQLNSWRGLAVTAERGDIRPWTRLLDHLFAGAEPVARVWFERWCGYPLKYLGAKLLSAVAVWSAQTGQGKTLIAETLGRVYGSNFVSIPQYELEADHNSWACGRQLVLVDDVSSHDTRARADLLKKLITQRELNVNIKFIPQFTLPDHINYFFTSNHGDAFYLDEHDRRMFIHEVRVSKLDAAFYDRYYAWLDGNGPAALLYHFQNNLDYGDFSPTAPPPVTLSKTEMIDGTRTELDAWLLGLKDLDLGGRELWTAGELCERFNSSAVGRKVAPNGFGRWLKRHYPCVGLVDEGGGKRNRYYALKNGERWLKAAKKEVANHVTSTRRF